MLVLFLFCYFLKLLFTDVSRQYYELITRYSPDAASDKHPDNPPIVSCMFCATISHALTPTDVRGKVCVPVCGEGSWTLRRRRVTHHSGFIVAVYIFIHPFFYSSILVFIYSSMIYSSFIYSII